MSENEQDPNGASDPKAEPILRPALRRLNVPPSEPAPCAHKWIVMDKIPQPSRVADALAGIAYVFHCERCLEIQTRLLTPG